MADDKKRLTPLETVIMNDLWKHDTSTVREVMARLKKSNPMAYTTVLTVMRRLREKRFLTSERDGRTDRYQPTVSKEQMASRGLSDMLGTFFAGSSSALVSYLLENEQVDAKELGRIRKLVDERLGDEETTE